VYWSKIVIISLKCVKYGKSYYRGPIGTHQRSFQWLHPRPPTASPSTRLGFAPHPKLQLLLSHEQVKLRGFTIDRYIHRVNTNKKPLKIFKNRERGRIQGLPNFWGKAYPLLSQKRVKPRTSNSADTFAGSVPSVRTKVH